MERKLQILPALRTAAGSVLNLFWPPVCPACCGEIIAAQGLCAECNAKLLALAAANYCPRCGSGLGPHAAREDGCAYCPPTLPRFDRVVRLGPYAEPLRTAIRSLKYHRQETLRRRMAKLLATTCQALLPDEPDLVLSIPMHWRRRLARGYDQARMLASTLADELGAPLGDELIRIRHTPPQARLPRTQRLINVRGAFAVRRTSTLQGATILLVDDVTTTGATADEAARVLLAAGAHKVHLAVIAKAEPPQAYSQRSET